MITCRNISKSYSNASVFKNFSYNFPETGMILLYGESGCGKTTLLNILAGLIPFDSGEILFGSNCYKSQTDLTQFLSNSAYITQDVYFIDYLNVMDNLRLCSTDDAKIENLLAEFDMLDLKEQFPDELSGGQRQRIALMQALLSDKHIFLLDEPTASLDYENKICVLQMLSKLKGDHLIICSSHDREFFDFADQVIDFHDLNSVNIKEPSKNPQSNDISNKSLQPKRKLWPFFKQWYLYSGREKKSSIQMVIVFALTILALCLGDTPENKIDVNAKYLYHLNQLCVSCPADNKKLLNEFKNNPHIISTVLDYSASVPDGRKSEDDINVSADYDMTAKTIPFDSHAFRLSDHIAYGSYYTGVNQIILSYEMAESLGNPASLIGETYHIKLYGGSYDLKIVGVFSKFSKNEDQYFSASRLFWTDEKRQEVFLNSAFTQRYLSDPNFKTFSGYRNYVLYFDSYENMKSSYKNYKEKFSNAIFSFDIDASIEQIFKILFYILVPLTAVLIPVSLMFYYQTKKIEITYNKYIFSVYQYLGYGMEEIKRCWILGNLLEIICLLCISAVIAAPLMISLNILNRFMLKLFPYIIFTFNQTMILILCAAIVCFSICLSWNAFRKLKITDWYKIFMEHRDLI